MPLSGKNINPGSWGLRADHLVELGRLDRMSGGLCLKGSRDGLALEGYVKISSVPEHDELMVPEDPLHGDPRVLYPSKCSIVLEAPLFYQVDGERQPALDGPDEELA